MKDPFDILRAELVSAAEGRRCPRRVNGGAGFVARRARWLSCWRRW